MSFLFIPSQNAYKEESRSAMAKGYELPYDTPAIKQAKASSLNCSEVSETTSVSFSLSCPTIGGKQGFLTSLCVFVHDLYR